MHAYLVALVLGVWTAMHAPASKDRAVIADAIATVIAEDMAHEPVFGSHDEDAAVMAGYAVPESDVRLHPGHWVDPKTGKEVDPIAQGPWQTHRLGPEASALDYARDWLAQLRDGKKWCPESPAAPLSGSCLLSRKLADRRVRQYTKALADAQAASLSD